RTVKDLLSLTPELFSTITNGIIDSVQRDSSQLLLLDENITTPVSKDEIFEVVSKDGVSEAAIIKWIILESARQDGMSRKEINKLIQAIVLETKASNTPENVANIFAQKEFKDFIADKEKVNIVIIQTPFSQTRAGATLNKFLHKESASSEVQNKQFNIYNMSFDIDSLYYHYKNTAALTLSLGEWTRLIAYSLKGDVIPIIDSEEGLNAIPLEILINIVSLLPTLNDKEKANLLKIFKDVAKQNPAFSSYETLLPLLQEQITDDSRFLLISDFFVKYLYSDTTEQRLLEKTWESMQSKDILPDIVAQEQIIINERVENTQKILSAA
ncbi:MAG: hypothetical protein IKN42_04285, partial [Elusimicrobia bacterium]|nr:hypothetical protein [Elusimicrobiota bacterium]